jgi:hypothetical protein
MGCQATAAGPEIGTMLGVSKAGTTAKYDSKVSA